MIITQTRGLTRAKTRLNELRGIVGESADDALSREAEKAYKEMVSNANQKGMTLKQLELRDYPFATRHGERGSAAAVLGGKWTRKPWMVFSRAEKVARSIRYDIKKVGRKKEAVFHYRYQSPYVKWVVKGTRVMVARNVILETLKHNKPVIRKRFRKNFFFTLNRRSKRRTGMESGFVPADYKPGQFR